MTTTNIDMTEHILQSNEIENVHGEKELHQSLLAWHWLELQPMPFTGEIVLGLHARIMKNFLPGRLGGAGSYRVNNVTVGGRMCPHWREVPEKMDDWLNVMLGWDIIDPKDAHIQFEHVHPFVDGSGRSGRMLMWKHELSRGYIPTLIEFEKRWEYYEWF